MAGELALPVAEYPDDFFVITRGFNPSGEQYLPVYLADRDFVVDGFSVRYATANGAALTGNLAKVNDGVAMSTNTNVTGTVNLNTTANTRYTGAVVTADNLVTAGQLLILELSGVAGALAMLVVEVRCRSRKR